MRMYQINVVQPKLNSLVEEVAALGSQAHNHALLVRFLPILGRFVDLEPREVPLMGPSLLEAVPVLGPVPAFFRQTNQFEELHSLRQGYETLSSYGLLFALVFLEAVLLYLLRKVVQYFWNRVVKRTPKQESQEQKTEEESQVHETEEESQVHETEEESQEHETEEESQEEEETEEEIQEEEEETKEEIQEEEETEENVTEEKTTKELPRETGLAARRQRQKQKQKAFIDMLRETELRIKSGEEVKDVELLTEKLKAFRAKRARKRYNHRKQLQVYQPAVWHALQKEKKTKAKNQAGNQ